MKKVFVIIISILLFSILCSSLYQRLYEHKDIVDLFGLSMLIVNTGSMEPTIYKGDLIIIKNKNEYKVNDIVTYIDNEGYCITHRIINKENNLIITKGDFNNIIDEQINVDQIHGKVIFNINFIIFFIMLIMSFILFIIIV